jgi:hypothetical protein
VPTFGTGFAIGSNGLQSPASAFGLINNVHIVVEKLASFQLTEA